MDASKSVCCIPLELSATEAAALLRFVQKSGAMEARAVLYPHLPQAVRDMQAAHIMSALAKVQQQLQDAGVSSFPWLQKGAP